MASVSLSKTVADGKPALSVKWIRPNSDVTITQYRVQYKKIGIAMWNSEQQVRPFVTSVIIKNLIAGTEYDVRVRAISDIGDGNWSDVKTNRTFRSEF